MPVVGTKEKESSGGGEGEKGGEEEEAEENYGLFRNYTTKSVWANYSAVMRVEKLEGSNEEGDRDISGDGESEVFESTILYLNRLDTKIMTVLNCAMSDENSYVQRQKRFVYTPQKRFFLFPWGICLMHCTISSSNGRQKTSKVL